MLNADAPVVIEGASLETGPQARHSVRLIKIVDPSVPLSAASAAFGAPRSAQYRAEVVFDYTRAAFFQCRL